MPELPEVQTVVDTLKPRLTGKKIVAVTLNRNDILTPSNFDFSFAIENRNIAGISRRGKRIIFELNDGNRFYIHLGMSGRLTIDVPAEILRPHTHLVIDFGKSGQLRFVDPRRFGGIWWLGSELPPDEKMGPEPLTLTPAQLARRLSKTSRAIKNALLDQTVVAGLGNIYVDESLFTAGLHPLLPADQLAKDQIARLNRAIKQTLRKALRHRGSTLRDYRDADGNAGNFQSLHRVYDRAGEKCLVCKSMIERIVLGGRSTHFCLKCQPRS